MHSAVALNRTVLRNPYPLSRGSALEERLFFNFWEVLQSVPVRKSGETFLCRPSPTAFRASRFLRHAAELARGRLEDFADAARKEKERSAEALAGTVGEADANVTRLAEATETEAERASQGLQKLGDKVGMATGGGVRSRFFGCWRL